MKRKDFLKKGIIAGAAGATLLNACTDEATSSNTGPAIITDKKIRWKMVTTWPPNFPILDEGCRNLAKWINVMSGGRIEIEVYHGGVLVPPLQTFEAVSSGAAEMGHGVAYYWAGIQPAFQYFSSVPFGLSAQQMNAWLFGGGGMDLYTELYADYNLVPFIAGNTGVQMGGWFNKKIDSVADFKGLKMRMPGLGGKVLQKMGGTAVLSPGSELYTNLERGVIDATEWIGPYHDYTMGFHQIAKYYYYPGWHETGSSLECIVNKRDFENLTPDLQEIVRTAMYRSNQWILAQFESKNNEYLQRIKDESDVQILPFSDEVLDALKEKAMEMYAELTANDAKAKRVHDSVWKFKKMISEWHETSEKKFLNNLQ